MKIKKTKTMFVAVFLVLMALPHLSITTINKKMVLMREISRVPYPVLQVISNAKHKVENKIYIFVSEKSISEQIINHPELHFNMSLFTFTAWKNKPSLNEIYAYMYEDDEKMVAFIGPQPSISPNVSAHELGHMFSFLNVYVSSNEKWLQICRKVWAEKSFNGYFLPSGQTAGRGLSAEEQAAEELFAECIAYMAENKLDEFMGIYADETEEFIRELSENYKTNSKTI